MLAELKLFPHKKSLIHEQHFSFISAELCQNETLSSDAFESMGSGR